MRYGSYYRSYWHPCGEDVCIVECYGQRENLDNVGHMTQESVRQRQHLKSDRISKSTYNGCVVSQS